MTCNPIQASHSLPDGIPSPAHVVFIFDTMLTHVSPPQRVPSSAGSSSLWNADAAETGALRSKESMHFQLGQTPMVCKLQAFKVTNLTDWAAQDPQCPRLVLQLYCITVFTLSDQITNEQKCKWRLNCSEIEVTPWALHYNWIIFPPVWKN